MALLGKAALAMWWNMESAMRPEFEDWHSHEHFPERLGIPGFLRSSRWLSSDGGDGVFVLYELEGYEVLSSPAYLARLNAPTPWSTKLMPHHRHMVRSQSHVLESHGAAVARYSMTIRLTPAPMREEELQHWLGDLAGKISHAKGFTGLHVLRHETPNISPTTEQKIRGSSDQAADWVLLVSAYDEQSLEALLHSDLSNDSLLLHGAIGEPVRGRYCLSHTATPRDID